MIQLERPCTIILSAFALLLGGCAIGDQHSPGSEKRVSMGALPPAVATTLQQALGDHQPDEIDEIYCEGILILYEAEYTDDGKEFEIAIWPDGTLVEIRPFDDDDEDGGTDEGDDDGDDDDLTEHEVSIDDVPAAIAAALRNALDGQPINEVEVIRYEGLIVLYEAESDDQEVAVYPNGELANRQSEDGDDVDDDHNEDDHDD